MTTKSPLTIPVIDLFAGPGGLGEGFSSFTDARGRSPFDVRLSIEMDAAAHSTLLFRAFKRKFDVNTPGHEVTAADSRAIKSIYEQYPKEAALAAKEAVQLELGAANAAHVRTLVAAALNDADPWVLVGGPPCQAYSLIGRARRRGISDYSPGKDVR